MFQTPSFDLAVLFKPLEFSADKIVASRLILRPQYSFRVINGSLKEMYGLYTDP